MSKSPFTGILLSLIISFIPENFKELYMLRLINKTAHRVIYNHCDNVWVKLAFHKHITREAVEKGDYYVLEKALKFRLPMNIDEVFYCAIDNNNVAAMNMIIDTRTIEFLDSYNGALGCACSTGNIELAQRFLELGADINSYTGIIDSTPLIEAIDEEHIEVVRFLISKGADINKEDNRTWPLHMAIASNSCSMAEMLLSSRKCRKNNKRQIWEVRMACLSNSAEMIKLLHRYGHCEPHILNGMKDGVSHLKFCVVINNMEAHKALLELGAK
jgi:hypothetical protein